MHGNIDSILTTIYYSDIFQCYNEKQIKYREKILQSSIEIVGSDPGPLLEKQTPNKRKVKRIS